MLTHLLLLSLSVAQATPEPAEQQIAGWVADLASPDHAKRVAARDALVKLGPKAKGQTPALVKLLDEKDVANGWARLFAIEALGAIGPDAKAAEPKLRALLKTELPAAFVEQIVIALGNISGPSEELTRALLPQVMKGRGLVLVDSPYLTDHKKEVARHLLKLCDDKDESTRGHAIQVLTGTDRSGFWAHERGTVATDVEEIREEVRTVLERRLADEHVWLRMTAALGYSKTFPRDAAKVVPVVVKAMTDEKTPPGYYQCELIFAPVPEEAAKALVPLLDGPDHGRDWAIDTLARMRLQTPLEAALKSGKTARTREAAAMAIGRRIYSAALAVPPLREALKDADRAVRLAAAIGILDRAEVADPALDETGAVFREGLKSDSAVVRLKAAESVRRLGGRARSAVAELKPLLTDTDPKVAAEAALAMVELSPADAEPGIPALIVVVEAGNDVVRVSAAARALASFGPKASAALPALMKLLDADFPAKRVAAAEAIGRIDPGQAEKMTTTLVALHQKYRSGVGLEALAALGRLGPAAASAVPELIKAVNPTNTNRFRPHPIAALMAIDPEAARPHVEWLRKNMVDDGNPLCWPIVDGLSRLGSAGRPFVPELIKLLDSKDQSIQSAAARALANQGKASSEAVPKLQELAKSTKQAMVRREAALLIERNIAPKYEHDPD